MLVGQGGLSLRTLGGDRAGELRVGRFLSNPRVSVPEMVSRARSRLLARAGGRHVLAIQDTTSLRDDGRRTGVYLHPTIAVDEADGALLGLLSADVLVHDGKPKVRCQDRPLAEKESRRWIDATVQAADLIEAGANRVTMVADREADLYEMFACRPEAVDVLVRVHHNRCLRDGSMLYDAGETLAGSLSVEVPAQPGRRPRVASVSVRAGRVGIKCPQRNRAAEDRSLPDSVELTLLDLREEQAPAGQTPLHWRLLTTHPATSLKDAGWIAGLYRQRWAVEQVFRVMKTQGFDVEAVRFEGNRPLSKLACAILIAAIHIQQMLHDRDGSASRPIVDVFDEADRPVIEAIGQTLEGKTDRQKNPHAPGLLAHAAWICGRLGGWTGYYTSGPKD